MLHARLSIPVSAVFSLAVLGVMTAVLPREASAQVALVTARENFRADPNGTRLGEVMEGEELPVRAEEGRWVRVDLRGWIWSRSVESTDRAGFDLVVDADGGENLRAEPQGRIRARLLEGALLESLDRRPDWIEVRRVGWLWRPSVEVRAGEGATSEAEQSSEEADAATGEKEPLPGDTLPPAEWLVTADEGRAVLASPDGDTVARTLDGTGLRVLDRRGGWARVRLDGWVWAPVEGEEGGGDAGGGEGDGEGTAASVLRDIAPADLSRDPAAYRGRLVELELQFISLERADRVLTNLTEVYRGEPFLLTRTAEGAFVYVTVPPEKVAGVEALEELERITVVGRVRTTGADRSGTPIVELLELRRRG